jgi:hypothetical protein
MSEDRAAEYRHKAEECRFQAGETVRDVDKAAWLGLAADWQLLAESAEAKESGAEQRSESASRTYTQGASYVRVPPVAVGCAG